MKMITGSPNQKKIKKQITVLRKKLGMNEMLNYPFYGRNVHKYLVIKKMVNIDIIYLRNIERKTKRSRRGYRMWMF